MRSRGEAQRAQLYEDREREEERQRHEDAELYEWHEQQRARTAQLEDRATLAAHLGWSTRTTRAVRVQVADGQGARAQSLLLRLRPGERAQFRVEVDEVTDTEYLYQGEVQDPVVARQKLLEAEQAAVEAERETAAEAEQDRPRGRRTFRTADAEVRPREVETQSYEVNVVRMAEVPATVNYETDDDAETMIMGVFPEDEPSDRCGQSSRRSQAQWLLGSADEPFVASGCIALVMFCWLERARAYVQRCTHENPWSSALNSGALS